MSAAIDVVRLAPALVRALRGRRSQPALSRRLGYRSNVVYTWESGRREPSASELFRIVLATGREPRDALAGFAVDLRAVDLRTPEGVRALLVGLRGGAKIADLAERCGVSRYTVSRWLGGTTEPGLSELLLLIEVLTARLVDFVVALVGPTAIPEIESRWRELEARRRVAFTHPWSQAILRLLECTPYARRAHRPGWIAKQLGITRDDELAALDALERAGLVRWDGARYAATPAHLDTTLATPEQRNDLKRHWTDVARARIGRRPDDLFSWAVISLSRADHDRLRELHRQYLHAMRQLVEASTPSEVVAVANVQLFELRAPPERPPTPRARRG